VTAGLVPSFGETDEAPELDPEGRLGTEDSTIWPDESYVAAAFAVPSPSPGVDFIPDLYDLHVSREAGWCCRLSGVKV